MSSVDRIAKRKAIAVFLPVLALIVILLAASVAIGGGYDSYAGRFTLEEIAEYYALPQYQESPDLAALVGEGKLPPLEERLPDNPRVVKTNTMHDGMGEYGGVWRDTFAVPIESWNWGAGFTQGWFGINEIVQETLIEIGPMWLMTEPDPVPNLATDWEWSEDGKVLTMNLIRGAKWSDGHPFTADDVVFTYEHYILDPNIPSWAPASAWEYDGQLTRLEKVDDYTIRWHFPVSFPVSAFYSMDYLDFSVVPKHVYSNFHPAFNPEMTYDDLLASTPPHDLPPVTMGPWVPVRYEPGQLLIMVRNPYYWQVDEAGNQLPYIDEVWFTEAQSGEARTMNLIAGTGDRDHIENPQVFGVIRQASLEPDAHFTIQFGSYGIGYHLMINLSLNLGVDGDERELELRELFRDLRFRQAVAHALDRDAIADLAFPGPLTRAWEGGYPTGSSYYDEKVVKKHEYNPTLAKEVLAELGFKDTDGNGILNWPQESAHGGADLIVELIVGEDQAASVEAAEFIQPMLRSAGIDVRVRVMAGPVVTNRVDSGKFHFNIARLDSTTPFVHMGSFGPIDTGSPSWHRAGPGGERFLMPFEEEIRKLMIESRTEADAAQRQEIYVEILRLYTENLYSVGLYESQRGLGIAKRFRNVQPDVPAYLYDWLDKNIPLQIVWVPKELQNKPLFKEHIPTAESYRNRSWQ
jgi:peptide/nickel transport system substrate-binding protein